jgi:hypothetical protein
MEKMLITQALDERDFLRTKITDKINKLSGNMVAVVKASDTTTASGLTIDEFKEKVKSSYQSIQDLIKRYRAINIAINNSNNTETVTVKGKTYTRSEAIALRSEYLSKNSIDKMLNDVITREASDGLYRYQTNLDRFAAHKRDYINAFLGKDRTKDSINDDKLIETIENFISKDNPILIDPLEITKNYDSLTQEATEFFKELETAIKVSNATTFIEI